MIKRKNPTLSDVAAEANVAIKTASKVFKGDNTVRPYIKEHVLKVADKLNYRPNPIAQALRAKSLNIISVYIPELGTPFFGALFQNIFIEFAKKDLLVVPCDYIDAVNDANHTIYACATVMASTYREDIEKLVQKGPTLTISPNEPALDIASDLSFDFEVAYTEMTKRVLKLGRNNVAVYSPVCYDINHRTKFSHIESTLQNADMKLVTDGSLSHFTDPDVLAEACRMKKVDAIFCENDSYALVLITELQRKGIRIPDDVLIIGCDGTYLLDHLWTVVLDTKCIASLAVDLILNELNNKQAHRAVLYEPVLHTPGYDPMEQ